MTSRGALHLHIEREYPVPPLELPDPQPDSDVESIEKSAAVQLFIARVQAVKPDFQLTAEHAEAIAQICRRLDGLPLAIELAAARIRVLQPGTLLARLHQRLPLLRGGAQEQSERHQTLRDAIAWSYDLLDQKEQRLFRWLSVFVGGCTLEAVETVCGTDETRSTAILENVESLVDKHLVQLGGISDDNRLTMLETIREYALERLSASGEEGEVLARHAAYYLSFAEAAEPNMARGMKGLWAQRVEIERDNLGVALQWCAAEPSRTEMGMRLAGALVWFWCLRGFIGEGIACLESALERSDSPWSSDPDRRTALRAKCLYGTGALAFVQGDRLKARTQLAESLSLFRKIGDEPWIAQTRYLTGLVFVEEGDLSGARTEYQESPAHDP